MTYIERMTESENTLYAFVQNVNNGATFKVSLNPYKTLEGYEVDVTGVVTTQFTIDTKDDWVKRVRKKLQAATGNKYREIKF